MFIESASTAKHVNGNRKKTHCKYGHPFDETNTYVYKNGGRTCRTCHRLREFKKTNTPEGKAKNLARVRAWVNANRGPYREYCRLRRAKIFQWLTSIKVKTRCKFCGEKEPVCLDFHHRETEQKKFNIGISWHAVSRKKLEAEVAKCDVLCSNCHRKLHAKEKLA